MGTPPNPHRGHPAAPNVIGPGDVILPPWAFARKGFGAIAFSQSTRRYGWSYRAADRPGAERIALQGCQADDARILVWGSNTFLALALADNGAFGWSWDASRRKAGERAVANCAGPNPRIVLLYDTRRGD